MLEANEVITLIIVLFGYFSVVTCYRDKPSTKWFLAGYTLLIIGMLATNLEAFVFPEIMNLIEHGIGVAGAGIVFLYWAYKHYSQEHFLSRKLQEINKER